MDLRHTLAVIGVCSLFIAVSGRVLECPNDLTTVVERKTGHSEEYSKFEKLNDTHVSSMPVPIISITLKQVVPFKIPLVIFRIDTKTVSLRICQCEVKPCLKKCCGKGQIMVDDVCQDALFDANISPRLNVSNFRMIYGNGCPANNYTRFYPDDYTNVRYYLRRNGSISIFFDADMIQVPEFCLERVFRKENTSAGEHSGLLICIPKDFPPEVYEFPIGMALSLPFLIATLAVYSFRELRNIHSKNLTSHVASLLAAYLSVIFVEIIKLNIPESLCIMLGLVRQFSFLSSFFWLNIMCFDFWWSLSNWSGFKSYSKDKEKRRFFRYSICGWGCPAIIVLITIIMDFSPIPDNFIKPGMGYPNCFLEDGKPFYAYFYGPVIFIFCVDVTLFILSAIRFITARRKMKFASVQDKIYMQNTKTRYILLLKIFVMMGINWIIDPFSWIFESSLWTWLFINLSITLQAVSIFVIFVWKTEVKKLLVSKFCSKSYGELTIASLLNTLPSPDRTIILKQNEVTQTTTAC